MNLNLQGKAAVVTGAAAGIGREVAHAFAREGVRVALVDIDAEGVHREAQALSSEATPCLGLAGDVADRSRVLAMIAAAHSSCFAMALSHGLAQAGTAPEELRTSSTVTFVPGEGITKVALTVEGRVPGIDEDAFHAAAEDAKVNCPVSKALASVPEITLDARLAG